ncbi:hypothetical protein [Rhodococcus sp. HNM0569]|uniref:hypothetical protein n=1 Tax=Rhodococcus sp. HNM0569 TaxID=2716340 RepID=UPI00146A72D2|nr:hypothetical protein [Rhodococcus sp. HNM0569]NLU84364.1 hypothetical protein [Rhodococcus sp. HNM0569]
MRSIARTAVLGAVLSAAPSACGEATEEQPRTAAPATTATSTAAAPTTYPHETEDGIDCGLVTAPGGGELHVAAVATDGGRVGCTEAFNVVDARLRQEPTDATPIDGWMCTAHDPPSYIGTCFADNGFRIDLRPSP